MTVRLSWQASESNQRFVEGASAAVALAVLQPPPAGHFQIRRRTGSQFFLNKKSPVCRTKDFGWKCPDIQPNANLGNICQASFIENFCVAHPDFHNFIQSILDFHPESHFHFLLFQRPGLGCPGRGPNPGANPTIFEFTATTPAL
jgi:hypothetical protein